MNNLQQLRRFHLYLILLLGLLIGCKSVNYKEINVDIHSDSEGLKVQIDTIFCLETNDESLIGEIYKIRNLKDNFYVLDLLISKNIFLFNKKGEFISSLPKGKGPKEVIDPVEILIDRHREEVLVWDQGHKKLFRYDYNLNYIDSEYHEELYISAAEFIDNNRILINSPILGVNDEGKEQRVLYAIFNIETRKYETSFFPVSSNLTSLSPISPISVTPNRVLFSAPFDNSLYTLENGDYKKVLHFNFGDFGITNEDLKKGINYVFKESWQGRKITPFYSISESEKFLSGNFGLSRRDNFFIYSKNTEKSYFSFNFFNKGLLPTCRLNSQVDENQFLAFASPNDIIEFAKSYPIPNELIQNLNEASNPCIVIFSVEEKEE
jgi:hypothetical protein